MTETTEEIKTKIHGTTNQIENAFKRGDILEAIQMLRGFEHRLLIANSKNAKLKTQVNSLTKERDELKFKAKDHAHQVNAVIKAKNKFQDENEKLKSQLSKAAEENKELKFGKPIEDAPTDGTPVLAWKTGSSFQPFTQHCEDGVWGSLTSAMGFEPSRDQPDRFIYLPVTSPNDLAAWRPDLLKSKGEEE